MVLIGIVRRPYWRWVVSLVAAAPGSAHHYLKTSTDVFFYVLFFAQKRQSEVFMFSTCPPKVSCYLRWIKPGITKACQSGKLSLNAKSSTPGRLPLSLPRSIRAALP
ncbi:hypothetical protein EC915_10419 [Pseudomonas sp. LP_7_YM]|nr:hypothetical protein EC915_10419 [Pseudomonas sp. LP_7_YM]